jgi:hypothetical protein
LENENRNLNLNIHLSVRPKCLTREVKEDRSTTFLCKSHYSQFFDLFLSIDPIYFVNCIIRAQNVANDVNLVTSVVFTVAKTLQLYFSLFCTSCNELFSPDSYLQGYIFLQGYFLTLNVELVICHDKYESVKRNRLVNHSMFVRQSCYFCYFCHLHIFVTYLYIIKIHDSIINLVDTSYPRIYIEYNCITDSVYRYTFSTCNEDKTKCMHDFCMNDILGRMILNLNYIMIGRISALAYLVYHSEILFLFHVLRHLRVGPVLLVPRVRELRSAIHLCRRSLPAAATATTTTTTLLILPQPTTSSVCLIQYQYQYQYLKMFYQNRLNRRIGINTVILQYYTYSKSHMNILQSPTDKINVVWLTGIMFIVTILQDYGAIDKNVKVKNYTSTATHQNKDILSMFLSIIDVVSTKIVKNLTKEPNVLDNGCYNAHPCMEIAKGFTWTFSSSSFHVTRTNVARCSSTKSGTDDTTVENEDPHLNAPVLMEPLEDKEDQINLTSKLILSCNYFYLCLYLNDSKFDIEFDTKLNDVLWKTFCSTLFDRNDVNKGSMLYAAPQTGIFVSTSKGKAISRARLNNQFSNHSCLETLTLTLKNLTCVRLSQQKPSIILHVTKRHVDTITWLVLRHDIEINPGPNNNTCLKIITLNCRGLGEINKFWLLLNRINKITHSCTAVVMLQETMITTDNYIQLAWRGKYVLTPGTGNS